MPCVLGSAEKDHACYGGGVTQFITDACSNALMIDACNAALVLAPILWRLHSEVSAHANEGLPAVPQAHTLPQITQVPGICSCSRSFWSDLVFLASCLSPGLIPILIS